MRYFIVLLLLFLSFPGFCQEKISLANQQADLQQLYLALLANHPKISTKADSALLTAKYDSIIKQLHAVANQEEVINLFSKMVNSIGCGHTTLMPPLSGNDISALPIKLRYIQQKPIVVISQKNIIPKGAEIIKINHDSISALVRKMDFLNSGVDNYYNAAKMQSIYDLIMYKSEYLYKSAKAVSIDYLWNNELKSKTIGFVTGDSMKYILNDFDEDKMFPLYYFTDTSNKTIYIKLSTFMYDLTHPSTAEEMAKEMDEEEFDNVIIDLRGNGGGSIQFGSYFLGYFLKDSTYVFDNVELKKSAKDLFYKSFFNRIFYKSKELPDSIPSIYATFKKEEKDNNIYGFIAKQKINFSDKKIFVLIDKESFSMAPICAQLLKNDGATIIGEEAGGRGYLNYAIVIKPYKLKKTKIRYYLPFFKGETHAVADYNPTKNLMPNYYVTWTVDDVKNKVDPYIEKVKELIKKK